MRARHSVAAFGLSLDSRQRILQLATLPAGVKQEGNEPLFLLLGSHSESLRVV